MSNIWSNAVITTQGLNLQAKLIAGTTLNITKAQAGAGSVSVSDLPTQTAVTNPMQTLNLRPSSLPTPGTAAVPVYLENNSLSSGYTAMQIGIFAQDPDDGEILYFIAQADAGTGTEIPSASEMPGFTAEWTFYFAYGQASTVNVTVDPANTVSQAQATTMINQAVSSINTSQITAGVLPVARGGTGVSELSTAPTSGSSAPITSGGVYTAIKSINTNQITAGTLPVSRGGTGQTSVDSSPTSGSSRMVTSGGVYTALHAINTNQITAGALPAARGGTGQTSVDTTPTSGSAKMVTSGGVYTAVNNLQNSLNAINTSQITAGTLPVSRGGTGQTSVDTSPTSGSSKMVTSGGVYTALAGKQKTITYGTAAPSGGSNGDIYIRYS